MVALFNTAFDYPFPWPAQVYAVLNKYPNELAPHVVSIDVVDRSLMPDGTIRSERVLGLQQDTPRWINRLLGAPDTTYVREVSFVVPSGLSAATSRDACTPASPLRATVDHDDLLEPPKLLMASTNLTMATLLQCRESISYLPHPWPYLPPALAPLAAQLPEPSTTDAPVPPPVAAHPLSHPSLPPTTLFSQSALIYSTGVLATTPYPPHGISAASPVPPLSNPRAATAPQRMTGARIESWSKGRFEMNAEGGRSAMLDAAKRFWRELGDEHIN